MIAMTAIIGVTGSRTLLDPLPVIAAFLRARAHLIGDRPHRIVVGGAIGVDRIIEETFGNLVDVELPDPSADYGNYNQAVRALHDRNQRIVDRATHLVGIWDGHSGGTFDCLKRGLAKRPGIPIIVEVIT